MILMANAHLGSAGASIVGLRVPFPHLWGWGGHATIICVMERQVSLLENHAQRTVIVIRRRLGAKAVVYIRWESARPVLEGAVIKVASNATTKERLFAARLMVCSSLIVC